MIHQEEATAYLLGVFPKDSIAAIYQVGMSDGSPLSDFDAIVVTKGPAAPQGGAAGPVDIRGIYAIEAFPHKRTLLPYASVSLIFGQDIPAEPLEISEEDRDTVRLAAMFFKSFLRNFYRLERSSDSRSILIHLNDFEYALAWLPETPASIRSFVEKVRAARAQYPAKSENAAELLSEGIAHAWTIIGILESRLAETFDLKSASPFLGTEPTLFAASASKARALTEAHPFFARSGRIIFLPAAFAAIVRNAGSSPLDRYAREYAVLYLKNPRGTIAKIKLRIRFLMTGLLKIQL